MREAQTHAKDLLGVLSKTREACGPVLGKTKAKHAKHVDLQHKCCLGGAYLTFIHGQSSFLITGGCVCNPIRLKFLIQTCTMLYASSLKGKLCCAIIRLKDHMAIADCCACHADKDVIFLAVNQSIFLEQVSKSKRKIEKKHMFHIAFCILKIDFYSSYIFY